MSFVGEKEMLTEDFLVLVISVAQVTQLGIGRDVWTLTPENIEKALKVSTLIRRVSTLSPPPSLFFFSY